MIAGACGIVDIALFWKTREMPKIAQPLPPLWESLRAPLRERVVRNYLRFAMTGDDRHGHDRAAFVAVLFGMAGMGQNAHRTFADGVSARGHGGFSKAWGHRESSRHAPDAALCVDGTTRCSIGWLLALPSSSVPIGVMLFVSGVLYAPYEISNLILHHARLSAFAAPDAHRTFGICAGTTFALTSWGAGEVAESLSAFRFDTSGFTFTNYHLIFAFSLLPRALNAFVFAPRLDEPDATATREVVNEVGLNLSQAVVARFTRFGARGE
jgi:hypothetical protein